MQGDRLGSRRLAHRGQVLHDPAAHFEPVGVVVDDQPVGGVEHGLVRAEVLGEDDLPGAGIVLEKAQDVGDGRPSPAIDGLVVVGHDRHVAVPGGQPLHQLELRVVRILELVHQDVLEPPLVDVEHVGPLEQQPQGEDDLIAEVDVALAGHQLLVLRVRGGELHLALGPIAPVRVIGRGGRRVTQPLRTLPIVFGRDVLVLAPADERDDRLQMSGRIPERAVAGQRQLEEPVAQEDDLLGATQHAEIVLETDLQRVAPQQAVAEGVKGGDLDVGVPVGHELVDALFHLGGGLVGERQREDLFRASAALGDQPGDAAGDDGGLAGAGPGHDEQRAGVMGDSLTLGVVETIQDAVARHAASL